MCRFNYFEKPHPSASIASKFLNLTQYKHYFVLMRAYSLYKVINKNVPSFIVEEYVDGEILNSCVVDGGCSAYFGWVIT